MELTAAESRVLGALIEKHMTTPDHYPLTTKGLIAACNQSSNRDPVVVYDEDIVIDAMNALRELRLAKTVRRHGERAMKHMEVVEEPLEIDRRQKALLAVLMLRGPQTVGELRSRTERYCTFADLDEVAMTIRPMEQRDEPLVVLLDRQPGQKEARYLHLLSDAQAVSPPETAQPAERPTGELAALRQEVADLRAEVAELRSRITSTGREAGVRSTSTSGTAGPSS